MAYYCADGCGYLDEVANIGEMAAIQAWAAETDNSTVQSLMRDGWVDARALSVALEMIPANASIVTPLTKLKSCADLAHQYVLLTNGAADTDPQGTTAIAKGLFRAGEGTHHGLLISLWVPTEAAQAMALTDGERPEDLHITLAYCADVETLGDVAIAQAIIAVANVCAETEPFSGRVSGTGRFPATASSDWHDVVYAVPKVHGLHAFREAIVDAVTAVGVPPRNTFDRWIPHITLAYIPVGVEAEQPRVFPRLTFNAVTISAGGVQTLIPLGVVSTHTLDAATKEFREEDHPRGEDGRWVDGGGQSGQSGQGRQDDSAKYEETLQQLAERQERDPEGFFIDPDHPGYRAGVDIFIRPDQSDAELKEEANQLTFYHGTTEQAWRAIQQSGLVPKGSAGGDEYAKKMGQAEIVQADVGGRAASVYMTPSEEYAKNYANIAALMTGSRPVILKVKAPSQLKPQLHRDEMDPRGWRVEDKIPPSWISRVKAGPVTFYVVLLVKEPKATKEYDEALHPRGDDGRWIDAGESGSVGSGERVGQYLHDREAVAHALQTASNKIRNLPTVHAIVIEPDGTSHEEHTDGELLKVTLPDGVKLDGRTLVHNHRDVNGLSIRDGALADEHNVREICAVTPFSTHIARRLFDEWPNREGPREHGREIQGPAVGLGALLANESMSLKQATDSEIRAGRISIAAAQFWHQAEVWRRVAEKVNRGLDVPVMTVKFMASKAAPPEPKWPK